MNPIISILGCGWLGLPLGKLLVSEGYTVKGSTTRTEKLAEIAAAGIQACLLELTPEVNGDREALFQCDILVINIPPGKGNYQQKMQALIADIIYFGINRVIFVSTTSVYPQNNEVVTEGDAIAIKSTHSDVIWLDIEQLFTRQQVFSTTIVRFSGLIGGSYQPGRYASGRVMDGADAPVNMIHRDDCTGIIKTLIAQDIFGETFNASADLQPSRKEFMTYSCELLNLAPPIFSDKEKPYRRVNCDKLKHRTGYQFKYPDPLKALKNNS